jgi:hypothetical protein
VRGVSDLFLAKLDDQQLAVLESVLAKVTLDLHRVLHGRLLR